MKQYTRLTLGLLAVAGIAAALAWPVRSPADPPDSRDQAPRHFLSGSERSLAILQEIQGTLERIDGRLQRIEETVGRLGREQQPGQPPVRPPAGKGERPW